MGGTQILEVGGGMVRGFSVPHFVLASFLYLVCLSSPFITKTSLVSQKLKYEVRQRCGAPGS